MLLNDSSILDIIRIVSNNHAQLCTKTIRDYLNGFIVVDYYDDVNNTIGW